MLERARLLRQKSPVNGKYRASDEGRLIGGKEQDRLRHLARLAQPSHRVCGFDRLQILGPPGSSGSRCTRSVLIVPGATALTRMPWLAHSTARCLVRPEATNFAGP